MWLVAACLLAGCDGVFGIIEVQKIPDAPVSMIDADLEPALVAWYKLDEGTGPTFADSSGHGHTGKCVLLSCPIGVRGHIATGAHFDGDSDHIDVAAAPELEGTFTVALWIFFIQQPPAGGACPINKLFGTAADNSWQTCIGPDGTVSFMTSENPTDIVVSGSPLSSGRWHHVATRWDGSMKILSVDGVDVGQAPSPLIRYDGGAIMIGADSDGGTLVVPFDGDLDDIRIYNRALTTPEITKLAQE